MLLVIMTTYPHNYSTWIKAILSFGLQMDPPPWCHLLWPQRVWGRWTCSCCHRRLIFLMYFTTLKDHESTFKNLSWNYKQGRGGHTHTHFCSLQFSYLPSGFLKSGESMIITIIIMGILKKHLLTKQDNLRCVLEENHSKLCQAVMSSLYRAHSNVC